MALKPFGHLPFASAKATCSRCFAESMFLPSQQPGKSWMRLTFEPCGQIVYLASCTLSSKPVQVHESLAFFGPFWPAFASP